jgi:hypothetical protein
MVVEVLEVFIEAVRLITETVRVTVEAMRVLASLYEREGIGCECACKGRGSDYVKRL